MGTTIRRHSSIIVVPGEVVDQLAAPGDEQVTAVERLEPAVRRVREATCFGMAFIFAPKSPVPSDMGQ
jgi:ribosomal protein L18E